MKYLLLILLLLVSIGARGAVAQNETLPPPTTEAIPVKVGLYYIDISEIDASKEQFKAIAYLFLEWSDPRLKFSPEAKENLKFYRPEEIWTPSAQVLNAESVEDLEPPLCRVTADGTVYYSCRIVAVMNTKMNLENFPFDRQNMQFIVESSRYGSDEVKFIPNPEQSGLGKDIVRRDWDIDDLRWRVVSEPFLKTDQTYSRAIFEFTAKRDADYFLWKVIMPTMIFVFLTWSVLWMRIEDLETALVVSITVLLTAVVFSSETDSLLPKLGYRTWLDVFQQVSFLFIVGTVVEAVIVHRLHLGGRGKHGQWLRAALRILYPLLYVGFCFFWFRRVI